MTIHDLVEQHSATLQDAIRANSTREFFAHWPEPPSGKIYGETANADGEAAFKKQLNTSFEGLLQRGATAQVGEEESPWGFSLGVTYRFTPVQTLIEQATNAQRSWQELTARERAAVLIEALERASKRFFEIGYATMHTTGQGFVMAFQSSGPHGFDRALESVALGVTAQETFASNVQWSKPMGKSAVTISKHYRMIPKGVNLVIGCTTFPVWNTTPGMFAGLVTGNSVIVKPHPKAVLPIAIVVAELQHVLQTVGLDPHVVQLAVDSSQKPLTTELLEHPAVRIVDYTGGPTFGAVVQSVAQQTGKIAFTETAGVNCVILDSADNLDAILDNLAFSLCLYSGQMCTAPQNIFIPKQGMMVGGSPVAAAEVKARLIERIDALVNNEKAGPGLLGTIQNPATLSRVDEARALGLPQLRDSGSVVHAGFDGARSASPLVLEATSNQSDIYEREWFGPIAFVIETETFVDAVDRAARSARMHGALSTLVYTTNDGNATLAEEAMVAAGAPIAFNFDSFVWVNQSAAFSDFHGTGANPAGTASFADLQFLTSRFNVVGVRKQAVA
ncbi:MAG: aldehyde dehydrogenase family protein [Bradyrhizobiaceae bacterium]|nr:aldehyde dehydrogenase family protein [Bradyrhizobiaceae bacterium]